MAADDPTVITDWNAIAESTVTGDATKPPVEAILYMAFVHAAVYDAVVGIDGRYAPYRFHAHAPHRASALAAAVAAAHKIMVTYSPYAPDRRPRRRGGQVVRDRELGRARSRDGRNAPILFTQRPGPGVWRPTPPMFAPMIDPWLGFVTPLLVRSPTRFAPPAPPKLTSARCTRDFHEVKALGSATSTVTTSRGAHDRG